MNEDAKSRAPDEKPGYWAVIPATVRYDPKIPEFAKLLFAEISSLTDLKGYCWASNAYFAELYGKTERTIQRSIKSLQDGGYVRILDGDGGPGRRKIFAGQNPINANPDKNVGVTPTKMSPNPDKNVVVHNNKKENKKENSPPAAPQGAASDIWDPEAWERFWQLYPKKKDKAKALKEWNRLKADRKLMRVMSAALRTQIASEEWQRDNGRAVPYPCRWLSHRRWEDELTVTVPSAPLPPEEAIEWV